ncbi:hypothetical protein U9M48_012550 [Paspalum notatum var. saurae]|uniref:ATG8-interacting protein 1 n=1 Tax=Paspalum notatum var. saurae TaxID=547442 RepID=A0AAQ3SY83_PASNO
MTADRELSPQLSQITPSKSRAYRSPPIAACAALGTLLPTPPSGGMDRMEYRQNFALPVGKVGRTVAGKPPTHLCRRPGAGRKPRRRPAAIACVRLRKKRQVEPWRKREFLCMEDDNMVTGVSPVTDEWDMLSLTSSVYASPLFRRGFEPINLPGYGDVNDSQEGTQTGLVMSDGFVFPPSEHENLPIEPDHEDLPVESGHDESNTNSNGKESCAGNNGDDRCHVSPEEVDGIGNENVSDNSDLPLPAANATPLPDSSPAEINAKQEKDNMICKADISCEGWWKRKSTYLFHHIKGVTTVCSIVAAGTVVGFVVMGQRWQQDHLHLHQFKFSVSSESISRVIGAFSRLKDGLPGSDQLRSLLPTRVLPQQPLSA